MKSLFGLLLSLSLALIVIVHCDVYPECQNVPNSQFIAMPNNCSVYIYCDGTDSFKDECPDGYFFNSANSMCDDPINVNCSDSNQTTSTTNTSPSAITTTPVSNSSPGQTTSPVVPSSTLVSQTIPTQTTSTQSSPASTTSPGPTSATGICPPSNSNQPESISKPGSCSEYYLCYNGNPILMECPNNLEFNAVKNKCDWASEANCVANATTTVSPLGLCADRLNGFFKYPDNCHYYYRCTNGMLTVQECPFGYGWDDNRRSCTPTGCPA